MIVSVNMPLLILNKNRVYVLLTLGLLALLVLPDLFRHGMFMDGTQYACVARNLANGTGSFWLPVLSSAWEKHGVNYFLEHPPLVYYLQSKFFILCKNSFLSERLYCLATLIICVYLIMKIWKLIFNNEESLVNYWWLPVLFWIIVPSVSWSFKNNMQENTMSVFILASVFFSLKSVTSKSSWFFIILTGIFIFLATLSKGLPGFFPVVILLIYHFVYKKTSLLKTVLYSLLLLVIPVFIYWIIYVSNSDARYAIDFYISKRLLDRISNYPQVENRFTVLWWLFTDLIVPLILIALIFLIFKWRHIMSNISQPKKDHFIFFVFLGFAGVLPLVLTHVQRAVYFVPAIPFFALAFSCLLVQGLHKVLDKMNGNLFANLKRIAIIFLVTVIGLCLFLFGKTGRDEVELTNVEKIYSHTGENVTVGTSYDVYYQWDFQFYLLRYHNITLQPLAGDYQFKLNEPGNTSVNLKRYKTAEIISSELILYKREDQLTKN